MERYIGRDALGIRRGKLPQSTICEMQARNRLLEYANCGSLSDLAGRFKYYGCGLGKCTGFVILCLETEERQDWVCVVQVIFLCRLVLFGKVSGLGKWTGKVQQHHRIGSRTNLQVGVLRNCRFVGLRDRSCI